MAEVKTYNFGHIWRALVSERFPAVVVGNIPTAVEIVQKIDAGDGITLDVANISIVPDGIPESVAAIDLKPRSDLADYEVVARLSLRAISLQRIDQLSMKSATDFSFVGNCYEEWEANYNSIGRSSTDYRVAVCGDCATIEVIQERRL